MAARFLRTVVPKAGSAFPSSRSDIEIRRLKVRREFLRVAKGRSVRRNLVVIQMIDRCDQTDAVGAGFTSTRKIGNAVVRNRARRRLREAMRALLPQHAVPGCDYVFIARAQTSLAPWQRLLDDVEAALIRLHREYSDGSARS